MNGTLMRTVLVAIGCTWALSGLATAGGGPPCKIKILTDNGDAQTLVVKRSQSENGARSEVHSVVVVGGQARDASEDAGNAHAIFLQPDGDREAVSLVVDADGANEGNDNDGWLGVQIGQAPDDDSELDQSGGVTILNVVEGSAAADAGFEQNDHVIEFNDVSIDGDIASLVEQIRKAGAGTHVKFTVLRNGERRTLATTLGSRADMKTFSWMFDSAPDAVFYDKLHTTARWLHRGEDNEWHFDNLSDPKNTLSGILEALPGNLSRTVKVFVNDGGTSLTTTEVKDGVSITVERADGGEFVVTRKSGDEEDETVTHYANEAEFEAADEEAYDIYSKSTSHITINLEPSNPVPSIDFNLDGDDVDLNDVLEKLRIELKNTPTPPDLPSLRAHVLKLGGKSGGTSAFTFREEQAHRSLHENADGTIEVIVRKGGNELVTHYSSALDLEDRNPDLFKVYQDLTSKDE